MTRPSAFAELLTALLLLVAGCSGNPFKRTYSAYGGTEPDTLVGQCERATYDDPQVKEALAISAGNAGNAQAEGLKQLAEVRRVAIQRCMSQRGGGKSRGGVELPR